MGMKKLFFVVIISMCYVGAVGQGKGKRYFKMPANSEYSRGRVWVKVKNEFKIEVTQWAERNSSAQLKNVAINSVTHAVKPEVDRQGAARMGARLQSPTVDMSKYFSFTFDKNQNVEEYINQL